MPLQKLRDYILESWLPTKLTVLIAGSSISLALLSIGLPEFLQTIMGHPLQPEKTHLLRTVVPLSILYLGTFVVLLLTIKYLKHIRKDVEQVDALKAEIDKLQQENKNLKSKLSNDTTKPIKYRPTGII